MAEPIREQRSEADVNVAAGERIDEQVASFARPQRLDHKRVRASATSTICAWSSISGRASCISGLRSVPPARLRARAAPRRPFRSTAASCCRPIAAPRRACSWPHVRRRSSPAHEPVRAPGRRTEKCRPCAGALMKDSSITPTSRPFIVLDQHRCFGDDGADRHSMPLRDARAFGTR